MGLREETYSNSNMKNYKFLHVSLVKIHVKTAKELLTIVLSVMMIYCFKILLVFRIVEQGIFKKRM